MSYLGPTGVRDFFEGFFRYSALKGDVGEIESDSKEARRRWVVVVGCKDELDKIASGDAMGQAQIFALCSSNRSGPWNGVTLQVNDSQVWCEFACHPERKCVSK